jgi:hypothetical protein
MVGWFPKQVVESSVTAAALLLFGYLLADAIVGHRQFDKVTRWALAFPALVAYALALMLVHMASGGRVLGNAWVVRGIFIATAAFLIAGRWRAGPGLTRTPRTVAIAAGGVVLLGIALWGLPLARMVPLAPPGSDTGWHMGWTSQLLNGETTPSALITGAVPNYYPWMFHGLAAFVSNLIPGGRAYDALGPLQLLQVTGALLALFALGHHLGRNWQSGAGVAVLGGMAAGVSLALMNRFDRLITTPRTGGPRGTYNVSFNNLAPPLPRDVAYSLFAAFLLLLVIGVSRNDRFPMLAAGVVVGLMGLTSGEYFFVALSVSVVTIAIGARGPDTLRSIAALVLPALIIYAIWLVPLMASYRRLGGFVDTTAVRAIVLSPVAILMSWGLSTPFAVYGAIRWIPRVRRDPGPRVLLATLAISLAVVAGASLVPRILGGGFLVLGRASRYWPVLHLGVAICGGLGLGLLLERVSRARRIAAAAVSVIVLALVLPLPFEVSREYPGRVARSPTLAAALLGSNSNVLTDVARPGRGRCVVATPVLALTAFSYTGYRLMAYEGSRSHAGNFARIRWREIYGRIPPEDQRLSDLHVLAGGRGDRATFTSLLRRYRVNLLVVPRHLTAADVYRGLHELGSDRSDDYAVFLVAACDH